MGGGAAGAGAGLFGRVLRPRAKHGGARGLVLGGFVRRFIGSFIGGFIGGFIRRVRIVFRRGFVGIFGYGFIGHGVLVFLRVFFIGYLVFFHNGGFASFDLQIGRAGRAVHRQGAV